MKRKAVTTLICCLVCGFVSAFEVQIAEFQTTGDSVETAPVNSALFNKQFFTDLIILDSSGLIGFKYRDGISTNGVVISQADAVKNCEINGWEILVYGQVVSKNYGYDVEVKIYSHPERTVIRTFLLRSAPDDFENLAMDCASKVYAYFASLLMISTEKKTYVAEGDSFITSHTLEWWGTIPPWNDVVTSIAGYHGSFGYRLGTPLWTNGEWSWLQEFGLGLGFHFGMNDPSVIDATYQDLDIGPMATWALVWQRQREMRLTVEPGVKVHILHYVPMYDSDQIDAWTWYGARLDLEYRMWLNSRRTFGIGLRGGVATYLADPFYLDYRVGVNFAWKGLFK